MAGFNLVSEVQGLFCLACYSTIEQSSSTFVYAQGTKCCSYGTSGAATMGFDCINIPGAEKEATASKMTGSNFCGRSNGLVTSAGNSVAVMSMTTSLNSMTICCEGQAVV